MSTITTADGVNIFYKDWGSGQPIVFSHGWPLTADDWDAQMMFFLHQGYRVIAHDRRGHGRSDQPSAGNDMDHWVADLAALTGHLDLRDAIHIGHSTGGGEVARYVARHPERVAKAVLVASLTPNMYRSENNPSGQPPEWFETIRAGVLGNRSELYRFVLRIRSTATTSTGPNVRRQSLRTGGAKAWPAVPSLTTRLSTLGSRIIPKTSRRSPRRCW